MRGFAVLAVWSAIGIFSATAYAHETQVQGPDYDRALAVSQAAIGNTVGEYQLLDQNGAGIAFSGYRGKPLVVSFVYTACSQVCPVATQFLKKAVGEGRGALGPDSFSVVTLGFNQPSDTPEALAAFARQNGIRDPRWSFLSADEKTMQALTGDLGFTYYPNAGGFDHISQVTILDSKGVVYRQVYGDSFDLPMLVGPLKELLGGQPANSGFTGVWNKVKLFCTVYDPNTGGYRVNYSLFVEVFSGASVLIAMALFLIREGRRSRRA